MTCGTVKYLVVTTALYHFHIGKTQEIPYASKHLLKMFAPKFSMLALH